MLYELVVHIGEGADGLGDGLWLADATGFNYYVVEAVELHYVVELLYEIHLQGTADASVLKCHKALVFLPHDTAFLNKTSINVHFANVVDDNGKFYVFLVSENVIYKCCFSAAQITREQQYWSMSHFRLSLFVYRCSFIVVRLLVEGGKWKDFFR